MPEFLGIINARLLTQRERKPVSSSSPICLTDTMSPLTRRIGDASFSAIGFGAMGISTFYGAVESDEERFKVRFGDRKVQEHGSIDSLLFQVLDAAYDLKCRHWDTAGSSLPR